LEGEEKMKIVYILIAAAFLVLAISFVIGTIIRGWDRGWLVACLLACNAMSAAQCANLQGRSAKASTM
jgi:hypothetical protein